MTAFGLALANLRHDRGRAAVSVTGAGFAVVLIFMQLGFLGATKRTATLFYDRVDFDVLIVSSEYLDFSRPGEVGRARLAQARSVPGVAWVRPLWVKQGLWRTPPQAGDPPPGWRSVVPFVASAADLEKARVGFNWSIVQVGVAPADLDDLFLPAGPGLFADDAARARAAADLGRLGTVFLDARSSPDFGDPARMPPGTRAEYNGQAVSLAGTFELGTGFSYTGLLLTDAETFARLNRFPADHATFGVVRVTRGTDPKAVAAALNDLFPRAAGDTPRPVDTQAFTRDELGDTERDYWVNKTAVGKLFTAGVVLALFVGAIFVYQMMVADIKKRMPEYATLKAVGYRFRFLFRVVVWQALFLAAGGFVGGLAAAVVLYEVTIAVAQLPMGLTWDVVGLVALLTTGMCVGSGVVAVRKVQSADPADLF